MNWFVRYHAHDGAEDESGRPCMEGPYSMDEALARKQSIDRDENCSDAHLASGDDA